VEKDFVDWLLSRLPDDPRLEVPPGDDAAVLRPPAMRRTVVTTDMLTEGVDFLLGEGPGRCRPRQVGRKAVAVNASDLAAMAARPEAVVVAVALPRAGGGGIGRDLFEGVRERAAELGLSLAGGDTNAWDGPLVVSVTAIGSVEPGRAWRRSGCRCGDTLVVTGRFGGSILSRHLDPQPRLAEAAAIAAAADVHGAIDVSDGLALDIGRMVAASGLGAVIDPGAIPIHPDAVRAARELPDGRSALDRALGDGEDFELVMAMRPAEARRLLAAPPAAVPLTVIGEVVDRPGLWTTSPDGLLQPLPASGYLHAFES
jgi:thiamine-monophosphate kinase